MGIRLKRVMRYDPSQKKLRLFRVMWESRSGGYVNICSNKVSVSLVPRLFGLLDASNGWRFTLLGLSISFRRSLSGIYV